MLLVLTDGTLTWDRETGSFNLERTNALPARLLRAFSEEPLFLDLAWARKSGARLSLREARFHEAVLQLAATITNRPKDELDGADVRAQRQTRALAVCALSAILIAGLFGLRQKRNSDEEFTQNMAASLAASSVKVLADRPDQIREAALLAIESDRLYPSPQANQALRNAVSLLPADAQSYPADNGDPGNGDLDQRVREMAFAPSGTILAAVRDNGTMELLDLAKRQRIGYFAPDEKPGARLAVGEEPKDRSLNGDNSNNAVSVAFNATGSEVANALSDGNAHVWAFPGGQELLRIFHGSAVSQVAFHPKANELATGTEDGHLRLFDVDHTAMIADFKCPGKIVSAIFSPGGDLLAALSSDGPVSLFDTVNRKLVRTMFGGGDGALALALSRDGKRLATAMGSFAFVWDVATGKQLLKATHAEPPESLGTQEWIDSVAISPDGRLLAYGARGVNAAYIWNLETGRQILKLEHDSRVAAVSFNADGSKLSTGSYDGTSRVWELPSGKELERTPHAEGSEVALFSTDGSRVATGGMTGSISVSEIRHAHSPVVFDMHGDVGSVAFSSDGRRLAIGAISPRPLAMVRFADTAGNTLGDVEFSGPPVIDKLFFSDASHLIAQWSDLLFLIAADHSPVAQLPVPEARGDLRIDASGRVLAMQPGEVTELYSLPGLQPISTVNGPSSGLLRIAGQGALFVYDTSKGPNLFRVDLWSVAKKSAPRHISLPAELHKLATNPGGTLLFTAEGESLQAWEVASGKRRFSIKDNGEIRLIVPDPSSAFLATVTDKHLTVWDAANGRCLAEFPDTNAAAFSADGRYLLMKSSARSAALWLWSSRDLRDEACGRLTSNMTHEEWARWFPGLAYHRTCANLPAGN